jgi:SAM-dependent methyltransferase
LSRQYAHSAEEQRDLASATTFDPAHFSRLAAVERDHFWFRARRRAIKSVLAPEVASLAPGYRVLEVGCGTGSVMRALEEVCAHGTVIGMDLYREGLRFVDPASRGRLVQGDLAALPFRSRFEVVGLFDVLEHFEDDLAVLASIRQLLREGGSLVLTVPARRALWSYFDIAADHKRRYEMAELRRKLVESGFDVPFLSPYMCTIYPLVRGGRKLASLGRRSREARRAEAELLNEELRIVPVVNPFLAAGLGWESRWLAARKALPFGTSLIAIARSRSAKS